MEMPIIPLEKRFRGYLPVVIDVETAGFNPKKHALLEIAAVIVEFNAERNLMITERYTAHVVPFKNAELDPAALKFTGIDPYHPFRMAIEEKAALELIFKPIKDAIKRNKCSKAILVGHNAAFDIAFLNAAAHRTQIKKIRFTLLVRLILQRWAVWRINKRFWQKWHTRRVCIGKMIGRIRRCTMPKKQQNYFV